MAVSESILSSFETIWFIVKWFWWLGVILWFVTLKIMYRNWPVDVVIIEKRGKNLIKTNDRAGKYTDKYTGIVGYRLQKAKDTAPVIDYDWVLHNVPKPTTIFDRLVKFLRPEIGTIFFFRYGSKQYKPIKVMVNGKVKISYELVKDKYGNPIYTNKYIPLDPRSKLGALDFEVVDWDNMNFMVQEQRASIERRKKKSEWLKQMIIPLIIIGVAALVAIMMLHYAANWSPPGNAPPTNTQQQQPAEAPNIPIIGDVIPGK